MKIIIKDDAKQDLQGIFLYTVENWGWAQADRYVDQIYETIDDVAAGQRSIQSVRGSTVYKRVRVGSHAMILIKTEAGYDIVRILHQSMDTLRHL